MVIKVEVSSLNVTVISVVPFCNSVTAVAPGEVVLVLLMAAMVASAVVMALPVAMDRPCPKSMLSVPVLPLPMVRLDGQTVGAIGLRVVVKLYLLSGAITLLICPESLKL